MVQPEVPKAGTVYYHRHFREWHYVLGYDVVDQRLHIVYLPADGVGPRWDRILSTVKTSYPIEDIRLAMTPCADTRPVPLSIQLWLKACYHGHADEA